MIVPSLQPAKMTSQHSTPGEKSELPPTEVVRPLSPEEESAEINSPALAGEPKDQGNPGSHLEPQNPPDLVGHPGPENEPDSESLWDYESIAGSEAEKWHQRYFTRRNNSIELVLEEEAVSGWPLFASYLAKKPYYASFSRFGELNVKNLLYYQTQLGILQKELHVLEHDDRHGYGYGPEDQTAKEIAMQFAERSDFLMREKESKQHKLILDIRLLLKEYNEALLQYNKISSMQKPDAFNIEKLTTWLKHADPHTRSGRCIGGEGEQNTWGDLNKYKESKENKFRDFHMWKRFLLLLWPLVWPPWHRKQPEIDLDILAIKNPKELNRFERWIANYLNPLWIDICTFWIDLYFKLYFILFRTPLRLFDEERGELGQEEEERAREKEGDTLAQISEIVQVWTNYVATVLACLFPVIAITVLAQLHNLRDLLLSIAGFVVVFAIVLQLITGGKLKSVDVFSATALFAAVMVVFIAPAATPDRKT